MDGSNLIDAADFLNVRPKWLIKCIGPKRYNPMDPRHIAGDLESQYAVQPLPTDPWTAEATKTIQALQPDDRRAAVLLLRTFVAQLGPARKD